MDHPKDNVIPFPSKGIVDKDNANLVPIISNDYWHEKFDFDALFAALDKNRNDN